MSDPGVAVRDSSATVAGWFDEHASSIARYASRRVGTGAARDVVAETFRVALERFDDFDLTRGGERAWLFGIATNVIRRHWRTEERRLRAQAQSMSRDLPQTDPVLRSDDAIDAQRRYSLLADLVMALPPADRDLLSLVVLEQMTSREAGDVLGLRAGTVRSRLNRIRKQLSKGSADG